MAFSQYPPLYLPRADLQDALNSGELSPTQVLAELYAVADSLNQAINFVRSGFTADKRLKPANIQGSIQAETQSWTATASQTEFLFSGGLTVDPTTATAAVFANGERLAPSSVTISADRITISARTAGDSVVADIFENADSVFARLLSTATGQGSSLLGLEDASGLYAASDAEGAFEEIAAAVNALDTAIGSVEDYLRADGSVAWTGNQSAGGQKLRDLGAGVLPSDAATVGQLTAATGGDFLSKTGGTMSGDIAMADNSLTGVADPVNAQDAVNKRYLSTIGILTLLAGSNDTTKVLSPNGSGGLTWRTEGSGVARDQGVLTTGATPPGTAVGTVHLPHYPEVVTSSAVVFESEASIGSIITQERTRIAIGEALGSAQGKIVGSVGLWVTAQSYTFNDVVLSLYAGADTFVELTNGTFSVKYQLASSTDIDLRIAGVNQYAIGDILPLFDVPETFELDPVDIDTLFSLNISISIEVSDNANSITGDLVFLNSEARIDKLS